LEWNYTTEGPVLSSPAIADLNGDGQLEVAIGSWDRKVYCLNRTGKLDWTYTTGDVIYSSPAIADLDGDGQKEVIIGSCDKNVYCLNKTGGVRWKYTTGNPVRSSPTISDIDEDNRTEIIIGSNDNNVYCLSGTGGLRWNFTAGDIISCFPAVADVNSDNRKEVIVGTWSGTIFCLSRTGVQLSNFVTGAAVVSSPTVADVDGDSKKEIVVGSEDRNVYCLSNSIQQTGTLTITVSDSSSGNRINGAYVYSTSAPSGQAPLSNLTMADGSVTFRDILVGSYVFAINMNGYYYATQSVYVLGNQTTTAEFLLTRQDQTTTIVSSSTGIVIAGIAALFLVVILVLRSASGGGRDDIDIPTYSYESTSQREDRSEVLEEPKERLLSPRICPYCGASYVRADASYCWNCGAGLAGESDTGVIQGRKRRSLATVGRCMVCNLDVKEGESAVWCPFCGNIAHRTHMLEWLHTRDYCPHCYRHLDERDLRPKQ